MGHPAHSHAFFFRKHQTFTERIHRDPEKALSLKHWLERRAAPGNPSRSLPCETKAQTAREGHRTQTGWALAAAGEGKAEQAMV